MIKRITGSVLVLCLMGYSAVLPIVAVINTTTTQTKPAMVAVKKAAPAQKSFVKSAVALQPPPSAKTVETASVSIPPNPAGNPGLNRPKIQSSSDSQVANARRTLSAKEYEMLVRIISAEAKGEPLKGQVAVGAVILNRMDSKKFPKTVTANVLKRGEFEPVSNGQIWSAPSASAYRAAQMALGGWDPTYGALYFYNPSKSTSRWIWSRPTIIRIGDHVFAG